MIPVASVTAGLSGQAMLGGFRQISYTDRRALRGSRRGGQRRYPDGMALPGRLDSEEQDHG
jgi:hypothetical protein